MSYNEIMGILTGYIVYNGKRAYLEDIVIETEHQ
jgi:hypothetical protein